MKLELESYQLHFFSHNEEIEPSNIFVQSLSKALKPLFPVVPITARELEPLKGASRDFLILESPEHKIRIEIPSQELVISQQDCTLDEFKETCSSIFAQFEELFPMKFANRLSIISNKIYTGSVEEYNDLYGALFTFKSGQPFEWDNRIVERKILENSGEEINSISSLRRLEVQGPFADRHQIKDVIIVDLDSNTIPQNNSHRFSFSNSQEIIDGLFGNTNTLSTKLSRYFD
jgi:hypothetical protein